MSKKFNYNEAAKQDNWGFRGGLVPMDIFNRLGSAWRYAKRGMSGTQVRDPNNNDTFDSLVAKLMADLETGAFADFRKSLWRCNYSSSQITQLISALTKNLKTLVTTVNQVSGPSGPSCSPTCSHHKNL